MQYSRWYDEHDGDEYYYRGAGRYDGPMYGPSWIGGGKRKTPQPTQPVQEEPQGPSRLVDEAKQSQQLQAKEKEIIELKREIADMRKTISDADASVRLSQQVTEIENRIKSISESITKQLADVKSEVDNKVLELSKSTQEIHSDIDFLREHDRQWKTQVDQTKSYTSVNPEEERRSSLRPEDLASRTPSARKPPPPTTMPPARGGPGDNKTMQPGGYQRGMSKQLAMNLQNFGV